MPNIEAYYDVTILKSFEIAVVRIHDFFMDPTSQYKYLVRTYVVETRNDSFPTTTKVKQNIAHSEYCLKEIFRFYRIVSGFRDARKGNRKELCALRMRSGSLLGGSLLVVLL